uniref:acylphosphatase n=1 Tax=Candidatus Methanophaga sp. ANME-1 ERB7 TaxID=2759913 RepID=A0A7G9Z1K3_9EURY|nr:acylphosphatase [Methanosarcinales archaeon ANME-1 ERB7]
MKRAVIIAKGEVQRVGYRDTVEKIARKLKLTGFVENLKPYDVRIVAEGEQDALDKIITQIRIKKHPVSPISVEDLDVRFEAATNEFEYFEIMRGDWQDELGERLDVAGALLYRSVELGTRSVELGEKSVELGEKSVVIGKKMLDKQDVMIEKQDEHTQILTEFRDQTLQGFVTLDTKYGRISDTMDRLIEEMGNERKETRESMAKLTDAILELARSKEQK